MKRKLYLVRYNVKSMEWTNLWFTHISLAYPDENHNIPEIGVNHKSILRIDRKFHDLHKCNGDEFYWKLELGGFYSYCGYKDGIDYFSRDKSTKPMYSK